MATIELIKKETKRGEYKATILDNQKKDVDFLLESIDGKYYTIWMNRPLELPKKSEHEEGNKSAVIIGERAFKAFAKNHTWLPNF